MYVALRPLKLSVPGKDGKDAKVLDIPVGKPVPGAEGWAYPTLIAHLNLHMIEWRGESLDAPHNAHKNRGVVIPMIFRQMAPKPKTPAGDSRVASTTTQTAPAQNTASGTPTCAACDGRVFKTATALAMHNRHKHPAEKDSQTKAG